MDGAGTPGVDRFVSGEVEVLCLTDGSTVLPPEVFPALDADTRARILAEHAAGNAALARRYFDRETLFSAPVPGPEAPVAPLELPADSYTLMQDFVAPFLRGLIVQNKEKPEKH